MAKKCANCGLEFNTETGAVMVPYRDECPTDRGVEVREGTELWCDHCYESELPALRRDA